MSKTDKDSSLLQGRIKAALWVKTGLVVESLWPTATILYRILTPNTSVGGLGILSVIQGFHFVLTGFQYTQDKQVKTISLNIVSKGPWACGFLISCWHTSTSMSIKISLARYGCAHLQPQHLVGSLFNSKANLICNAVEASQDYILQDSRGKSKYKTTNLKVGMLAHTCDPSSQVAEAGLAFEASLS